MASKKKNQSDYYDDKPEVVVVKPDTENRDWYDLLILKGAVKATTIPPQFQGTARIGLAYLKDHKEDLVSLGEAGFGELFNLLSSGAKGKARDLYVQTKMGPDALIAAMSSNNKDLAKAVAKQETTTAQFNALIEALGNLGVRIIRGLLKEAIQQI